MELMIGVNGEIIKWAREFLNITIDEAVRSLHLAKEKYTAYEEGSDFPTYPKLKEISNLYKRPVGVFFLDTPPKIDIKADLRSLSDVIKNSLSKKVVLSLEKAKVYQENLKELYGEKECKFFSYDYDGLDVEKLAVKVRDILEFPLSVQKERSSAKVLLELLREKFYSLGIYIFKDSFGDDSVSGLCIYDKQYPVIMLNNKMSFTRQVFTLFHELYHLIVKINGIEIVEESFLNELNTRQRKVEMKCDKFANEFLIPTIDFKKIIDKKIINEELIKNVANIYCVSREAILYKLMENNYISSDEYYIFKQAMGLTVIRDNKNKKAGGNPYYTKLSYLGQQYTKEIFSQLFTGKIDKFKACEFLGTKVDHIGTFEIMLYRGEM